MNRSPARRFARALAAFALASGCAAGAIAQDAGARYAKLLADTESYERYNSLITRQLDSQTRELASLEAQFAQLDATGTEVVALVGRMFEKLESFVAQDLPFLDPISDRKERIERLRNLVADQGVPLPEKYRRLLEAYQIEIEYGRNLATYPGKTEDGRDAEFVRIGRVALLYQTADGTESGYWDRNEGKWVVDNDSAGAVVYALRVAKKEVAPDVVEVPVPAAQEVGS
jgi:hypothetical protein